MKHTLVISVMLLLLGAGCGRQAIQTIPVRPETPPPAVAEPNSTSNEEAFDTNDYLDQALDELEATR